MPASRSPKFKAASGNDTDSSGVRGPAGEGEAGALKNAVKPVSNAIRILRFLSQNGGPARATQISKTLSINASTCFNILRTLVFEGVVDFDAIAKTYSLGLGILSLADSSLTEGQRVAAVKPILHDLAERYGVTATLWRRLSTERIVLVGVEYTASDIRVHMLPGTQLPLLMGASGRLFAHHTSMSKSEVRSAFKNLRWKQPLTFDSYWQQIEVAAKRGWSMDDGYFAHGVTSVAVPILASDGSMAFALSAVMFRHQYDDAAISKLADEMLRLAPTLSKILC